MIPRSAPSSVTRICLIAVLSTAGCSSTVTPPPAPPAAVKAAVAATAPAPAAVSPSPLPAEDLRAVVKRQEDENALLRERVAQRDAQVDVLQHEVTRLQTRTREMETTLARLTGETTAGGAGASPAGSATAGSPVQGPTALGAAQQELSAARQELATTQSKLEQERQRRASVESELQQLKQETSTAPLAPAPGVSPPQSDALAKARAEVDSLRRRLDQEHAERERTAAQLAALQANPPAPAPAASPPDAQLKQRLADLETRQKEILASAKRELDTSREHEQQLQGQLAAAQQEITILRQRAAQVAVPVASMEEAQAQNADLRKRLDAVERHNQQLNDKLKTAMRVADLIFKMRAGQVEPLSPPKR